MRKMPVLTMVCLVVLGLAVAPSFAATTAANDTPDIVLQAGETVSFDLADFFSSASTLTYTADGATVAGSVVTVDGSSSTATFTAGGVSVDSKVVVSSFVIGNGPAVDDNNRIAGKDGGNIFYNPLVGGGVIKSKVNLTGLPAVGGAGTSGGQTDVPALLTSVASVDLAVSDTFLTQVSRTVSTASGLTPVLNQDGSYSVTAGANFTGTWLVTLGATDGDSADAVHLLAAEAVAVDVKAFTAMQAGTLTQATLANGVVTAKANEGVLAYGSPISVGEAGAVVSLVADYTATADANIALVLFDGSLGGILAYCNPKAPNIATGGVTKSLSMSMVSFTGTVVPAFQVVAGAAATTVTLSNMAVVKAGPVTDYSLNPNACAFVDDLSSVAAWGKVGSTDIAPETDTANNFTWTSTTGCMKLPGAAGVSNALTSVTLPGGTASAECYAKVSSGTGTFAIGLIDGGALSSVSFQSLTSSWEKVIAVGTTKAAQGAYLVVQAAGFDALVDDIAVVVVEDQDAFADLSLLGL